MAENNSISYLPKVTRNILIINTIVWFACFVIKRPDLSYLLGLHYLSDPEFHWYQFITYMFTHVNFWHLFFNMFAVYMFAPLVEKVWKAKRFLIYYLCTGLGAAAVQTLVCYLTSQTDAITIGASGAVFGILLAFGMLFPNIPLYIIFIPIPIKAKYIIIGYGLVELFLGVASINGDNVAHFAHLGGMLFGIFLILYWKNKDKKNGISYHGNRNFF